MADVKERAGEVVTRAKRRVGLEAPSAADDDGAVGVVRGALRAFGSGEIDDFLDALAEDVTWEAPSGQKFPGRASLSGRDAVKDAFVADVKRTFSSFGFRPDSFLDADAENAVIAIGRFEGEGVAGKGVDAPGVQLWELKGNTVSRVCIFTDSAAFPEVVTEEERKEEQKKAEEEKKPEESDDQPEAKGESPQGDSSTDGGSESRARDADDEKDED